MNVNSENNKKWEEISEFFWTEVVNVSLAPLSESYRENKLKQIEKSLFNIALYIREEELDEFFNYIENNIILNEKVSDTLKDVGKKTIDVLDKVNQTKKKIVGKAVKGIANTFKYVWDEFIPDSVKKMGKQIIDKVKEMIMFLVKKAGALIKKAVDEIKKITKKIVPEKYIKKCKNDIVNESVEFDCYNNIMLVESTISQSDIKKYCSSCDIAKLRGDFGDEGKLFAYLAVRLQKEAMKDGKNIEIDTDLFKELFKYYGFNLNNKEVNEKLFKDNIIFYVNKFSNKFDTIEKEDIKQLKDVSLDSSDEDDQECNIDAGSYKMICSKKGIEVVWNKMKLDKYMSFDEFIDALGDKKLYIISSILSVATSIGLAVTTGGVLPIMRLISLFAFVIAPTAVEVYAHALEKKGKKEAAEFHKKLASALRGLATIVSIVRIVENVVTMMVEGGHGGANIHDMKGDGSKGGHQDIIGKGDDKISVLHDEIAGKHTFKLKMSADKFLAWVDGKDISQQVMNGGYDVESIKHICSMDGKACQNILYKIANGVSSDKLNNEIHEYLDKVVELSIGDLDSFIKKYEEIIEQAREHGGYLDRREAIKLARDIAKMSGISDAYGSARMGFYSHFVVDGKDIGNLMDDLKANGILNFKYGATNYSLIQYSNGLIDGRKVDIGDFPKPEELKEYIKLNHILAKYGDDKEKLLKVLYDKKDEFKDFINDKKLEKLVGNVGDAHKEVGTGDAHKEVGTGDAHKEVGTGDEHKTSGTGDEHENNIHHDLKVKKLFTPEEVGKIVVNDSLFGQDYLNKLQSICDVDSKLCKEVVLATKLGLKDGDNSERLKKLIEFVKNVDPNKTHDLPSDLKTEFAITNDLFEPKPFSNSLMKNTDLFNKVNDSLGHEYISKVDEICSLDKDYCKDLIDKIKINQGNLSDEKFVNYLKTKIEYDYDKIVNHFKGVEKLNDEYSLIKAKKLAGLDVTDDIKQFKQDLKDTLIGDKSVKVSISDGGLFGTPEFKEFIINNKDYSNILNKVVKSMNSDFVEDLNRYLHGNIDISKFDSERLKQIKQFLEDLENSENGIDLINNLKKHALIYKDAIDLNHIDTKELVNDEPVKLASGDMFKGLDLAAIDGQYPGFSTKLIDICKQSYGMCEKYVDYLKSHSDAIIQGTDDKFENLLKSLDFVKNSLARIKEDPELFKVFRINCDDKPDECLKYLKAANIIKNQNYEVDLSKVPAELVKHIKDMAKLSDGKIALVNYYGNEINDF